MSVFRERMVRYLKLAGLDEGTRKASLRSVRQLAAYDMLPPDQVIRIIQILLGHASNGSTEIYPHLSEPLREESPRFGIP